MQNLFLTEEDVFEVIIFVAVDDKKTVYCDKTEEAVKFLLGDRDVEIQSYSITFKKPSFGDLIALTDIVIKNTNKLTGDVNPLDTKLKAMNYLLNDWSFVDGNNNKIPPTEESFMRIDPIIAVSIGLQFDEALGGDETESDKSQDEKAEVETSSS